MRILYQIALLLLTFGATPLFAGDLFHKVTYKKALKLAKKENKVLFIDFYTTWCGPCKMMDRSTFKDKDVIDWLGKEAISIKIDAEKEIKLARKIQNQQLSFPGFCQSRWHPDQ